MRTHLLSRIVATALFFALGAVAAAAQVSRAEGKVTLKQADGTEVPVQGAIVEIYRTDISGKFQTKTDKSGTYVHAGVPFGGTYIIAVSAPGARPDFITGIRINQQPTNNFPLSPGDGSALTLEQIKSAMAAAPSGGARPAGGGGGGGESKEDKARREEMEKKNAEITTANKKIEESNAVVNRTFKAGNDAFAAKKFDEAIASYDEGLAADPEQSVFYLNKSVVLRTRGVERYNKAGKDVAARDAAKADFTGAVENAEKGIKFYRDVVSKRGAGAAAGGAAGAAPQGQDQTLQYLSARAEAYRLALMTGTPVPAEQAAPAILEYITAETDPAKKAKAEASLGDALFQAGKIEESVAAYQKVLASNPNNMEAMYGLGIALAADPSGARNTEARDLLQKFADKTDAANSQRKQEALEMVKYLDDTIKNPAKPLDTKGTVKQGTTRRKN